MTTEILLFSLPLVTGVIIVWFIYLGKIPVKHMYTGLSIVVILMIASIIYSNLSLQDLGISIPSKNDLIAYGIYSVIGLLSVPITTRFLFKSGKQAIKPNKYFATKILFYIFISSVLQEFVIRGYTFAFFEHMNINGPIIFTTFTGILNAWPHIIFKDKNMFIGPAIFGYNTSWMYYFFPNLPLAILMHVIAGLLGMRHNVIKLSGDNVMV